MRFLMALLISASLLVTSCTPAQIGVAEFPPHAREKASCIVQRESGGNPSAISPTSDYGLFQINRRAHKAQFERMYGGPFESKALSPRLNGKYAAYLYSVAGWSPWNGGRYAC